MKPGTLPIAFGVMVLLSACGKRMTGDHADGYVTIPVTFRIIDAGTRRPVVGATVRFLDAEEAQALDGFRERTDRIRLLVPPDDLGHRLVTDQNGEATISCRFRAAHFLGEDGSIVKSDWGPTGRLEVYGSGYDQLSTSLLPFFPAPPYHKTKPIKGIVIPIHKKANQSLETTPTQRPAATPSSSSGAPQL